MFSTKSPKSRVFWSVFACLCNVFLQSTVIYTCVAIKPFQNIIFYNVSNSSISPKIRLFTLFSSIFPCSNAAGQLKHIYIKSFKNIVFSQCFYNVFRQTQGNFYVFRHKVGPKHWFLQYFQCSGIQKPFKASLFTMFFHCCPFLFIEGDIRSIRCSLSSFSLLTAPARYQKEVRSSKKHKGLREKKRSERLKTMLKPPALPASSQCLARFPSWSKPKSCPRVSQLWQLTIMDSVVPNGVQKDMLVLYMPSWLMTKIRRQLSLTLRTPLRKML